MGRLLRHASREWYHGTTLERLDRIIAAGELSPGLADAIWNNTSQDQVFFCFYEQRAEMYCEHAWQHDGSHPDNYWVVLTCELNDDVLQPDKDDCPDCETWQQSVQEIEQVAVRGPVSINAISTLTIYFPELFIPLVTCTISEYQDHRDAVLSEAAAAY